MGAAEARHFQRIRHAAAGFFRQRLNFRIGIIVGDHHRIALLEQGFDLLAIKGFSATSSGTGLGGKGYTAALTSNISLIAAISC